MRPLIQERCCNNDPWRILVACVLLNQTKGSQVEKILEELFDLWSTPEEMSSADAELDVLIAPLGLRKRGGYLRELSRAYSEHLPESQEDVLNLPGCSRYAAESFAIFVEGKRDFWPKDTKLRARMIQLRLDECRIVQHFGGKIMLELPGLSGRHVMVVTNGARDIKIMSTEQLEKMRIDIPQKQNLVRLASIWLRDEKYIALSKSVKEILMLLLLSKDMNVIGKFADEAEKEVLELAPEGGYLMKNAAELEELTLDELVKVYNSLVPSDVPKTAFKCSKADAAKKTWHAAEIMEQKIEGSSDKPKTKGSGARAIFRSMMTDASAGYTMDQLVEALGITKKIVSDYLSMAKNPKYAGSEGILAITKNAEGRYHAR